MHFYFILFIVFLLTSVDMWAANKKGLENITSINPRPCSLENGKKKPETEDKKPTTPHSELTSTTQDLSSLSIKEQGYPPYISAFLTLLFLDKADTFKTKKQKSGKIHTDSLRIFKKALEKSSLPMEAVLNEIEQHIKIHFTEESCYKHAHKVLSELRRKTNDKIFVHYTLGGAPQVVRLASWE